MRPYAGTSVWGLTQVLVCEAVDIAPLISLYGHAGIPLLMSRRHTSPLLMSLEYIGASCQHTSAHPASITALSSR